MRQRPRIYYSSEQKNLMWDHWQAGDSLHEIARLFDRGDFTRHGSEPVSSCSHLTIIKLSTLPE